MPTLKAIFRLQDQYTSAIDRISSKTSQASSNIDRASRSTDNLNNAVNRCAAAMRLSVQFQKEGLNKSQALTKGWDVVGRNAKTESVNIDRASMSTDNFNTSARNAGSGTSALTSKLSALVGTIATFATVKKAMDISDTYVNTNSRLSLITNNLQQQKALQEQIFAAADRSRGSYIDMADTVSKLGIIAGEKFGGNQNIVRFTETMQKMFKIGGTPASNQQGAWLQLQQAIGMGKLQGQDLRILSEDAPLAEKAIAKYLNTSTGMIKKMGEDGKITSDVLIKSIMAYSGTVDSQISKMSYTWGDYWNKIKNGAYKAFSSVFGSESSALGSKDFKSFIDNIVSNFSVLANAANKALNAVSKISKFISSNWTIIRPIILGIVAAMVLYTGVLAAHNIIQGIGNILDGITAVQKYRAAKAILAAADASLVEAGSNSALFLSTMQATVAQASFNATLLACPLTWIIGLLIFVVVVLYAIVAHINKVKGTSISATGIIFGVVCDVGAAIWNVVLGVVNGIIQIVYAIIEPFISIMEFVLNAANGGFNSFGGAVANLIGQIISWFLSLGKVVTKIIDAIFGTNWTAGLNGLQKSVLAWGKNKNAITVSRNAPTIESLTKGKVSRIKYSTAWNTGYKAGKTVDAKVGGYIDKLKNLNKMKGSDKLGTSSNPTTVKGTGSNGTVTVNIADQDIAYLRDLAQKEYVNKFSSATLAPNINIKFTGAINKDVDTDQMYGRIGKILSDEIATSAEGAHM